MAKPIQDEFTDLPVSRERKRQLRAIKAGRCMFGGCKLPLATKNYCERHADQMSTRKNSTYVHRVQRGPYRIYQTARRRRAAEAGLT